MSTRIDWRGDAVKSLLARAGSDTVRETAEFLLEESNRTAPMEEGILIGSGFADVEGRSATISYDMPYVVRLHENPQYNFQHGRRGKWLQLTLNEQAARVERFIRDRLARAF